VNEPGYTAPDITLIGQDHIDRYRETDGEEGYLWNGATILVLTTTGRKSGEPRTTPIAIIEHDGRRWIWAPWGDVHWVRNLRVAGRATITVRRREEEVTSTELDRAEREAFFRDVLGPVAGSLRGGRWFIRTVDGVDLADPVGASEGRPVFELRPAA